MPAERGQELAQALAGRLHHHRFRGASANTLPRPRHFVTTVYFDTPSRHAYPRAAGRPARQPQAKLRAREYYDLHPSLAELATQPGHVVRHAPGVWLELKFRDGNRTGKQPAGHPPALRARAARLAAHRCRRPTPTPPMATTSSLTRRPAPTPVWDEAVLREIRGFLPPLSRAAARRLPGALPALPWQDPEGGLRVTLDVGVEFFAPPTDVWQADHALVRDGARNRPNVDSNER